MDRTQRRRISGWGMLAWLALLAAVPGECRDCITQGELTTPCTVQRQAWNDHTHSCSTPEICNCACPEGLVVTFHCTVTYCAKQARDCVNKGTPQNPDWQCVEGSRQSDWQVNWQFTINYERCKQLTFTSTHETYGCEDQQRAVPCGGFGQCAVSAYEEHPQVPVVTTREWATNC